MNPRVTDVTVTIAPASMQARGLLGWARFTIDGRLGLDGVGVRRTSAGRLALAFPERVGKHGRSYVIVRPLDAETRRAIEVQVFDALAKDGRLSA